MLTLIEIKDNLTLEIWSWFKKFVKGGAKKEIKNVVTL